MNNRSSNDNNENIKEWEENQKIGSAEEDPEAAGPSENLKV